MITILKCLTSGSQAIRTEVREPVPGYRTAKSVKTVPCLLGLFYQMTGSLCSLIHSWSVCATVLNKCGTYGGSVVSVSALAGGLRCVLRQNG